MKLEDLKDKYKALPLKTRFVSSLIVGILPGVYLFLSEVGAKEQQLETTIGAREQLISKIKISEQKLKSLKDLQNKKAETEEELKKIREFLPDNYDMENILRKTASIAKEVGVDLKEFEPKPETLVMNPTPYHEMRIKVSVGGTYQQLASYYDRISNVEPGIYVKATIIERDNSFNVNMKKKADAKSSDYDNARLARSKFGLIAKSEFAVFRGATDAEIKAEELKNKKDVKPDPKAPPAGKPAGKEEGAK